MNWEKKGMIFHTNNQFIWMKTHASFPIIEKLTSDIHRIYFSPRDEKNRSHIAFIEIDMNNPKEILRISKNPVMIPGKMGSFDDSGVMASSIVNYKGKKLLYYLGWNQGVTVPYRNAIGIAQSEDGGETFSRIFEGPIIDRSPTEPFFTASCEVKIEKDLFRMWYLSCTGWELKDGIPAPRYHIKYAESIDGITWKREGIISIDYRNENEWAISTPRVIKTGNLYKMFYSHRGEKSYRIGYAESIDGITWIRKDNKIGIDVSKGGWDSEMIEYPFVIEHNKKQILFYNGNEYGKTGIGYAILKQN
jgi:predicted GH43/DUF377 family glycosyl hydrolase